MERENPFDFIKKRLLKLALTLFSVLAYGQNCETRVEKIFDNLIEGIGNKSIYPPSLEFSLQKNNGVYLSDSTVTIEIELIELFCYDKNFDDKIAYILAHELAHHYLNHSWMTNTSLGYSSSIGEFIDDNSPIYSKNQRKLSESQADLFAGFYGMISGYNTLEYAKQTIEAVYEAYNIRKEIPGYPTFNERLEIIDSKIDIANDLASIFEIGNILLIGKNYELAKYCYEFILRNNFNSREIYNNLGLTYLQYGVSISNSPINSLLFPVSLDQTTRLEVNKTRSSKFNEDPKDMFSYSLKQFKNAQLLDSKYQLATQNAMVAEFLLLPDFKSRNEFLENLKKYDWKLEPEILVDMDVINMIIDKKSSKKINKIAKKGSIISKLNISKTSKKNMSDYNNTLEKLGLSYDDLVFNNFKKIADSKLKSSFINQTKVFQNKDLYIIKIPDDLIKKQSLTTQEKNKFIITDRGKYFLFNAD